MRIIETLSDYIYTVKFENGKAVETVHGAGCRMVTGYTSDDFRDNNLLWISMVHPDDRQRVKEIFDHISETPFIGPIEHRIVRKDGTERWVRNTLSLHFTADGTIGSCEGVVQDITDRKRAEQQVLESERRFREMFETSADGIAAVDLEGRILDSNHAFVTLLVQSEALGTSIATSLRVYAQEMRTARMLRAEEQAKLMISRLSSDVERSARQTLQSIAKALVQGT